MISQQQCYLTACSQHCVTDTKSSLLAGASLRLTLHIVSVHIQLSQVELITQSLSDFQPGEVDLAMTFLTFVDVLLNHDLFKVTEGRTKDTVCHHY